MQSFLHALALALPFILSAAVQEPATAPSRAKTSTLIGCLSGPNSEGNYTLRSMTYRRGVEVLGPDDLKADSGAKVELTGSWVAGEKANGRQSRVFRVTMARLLAAECTPPAETTPISKQKPRK
jgi:hypothetical protein